MAKDNLGETKSPRIRPEVPRANLFRQVGGEGFAQSQPQAPQMDANNPFVRQNPALSQAFAPASADSGFAAQSGPVEIPVDSFGRSPAEEDKEGLWNLPPILRSKSE